MDMMAQTFSEEVKIEEKEVPKPPRKVEPKKKKGIFDSWFKSKPKEEVKIEEKKPSEKIDLMIY
jgi:hypothetical protein